MSIKLLSEDDRPREKFLSKGKSSLSDSELLAIVLGSGNREESVLELSRRILASVSNSWQKLSLLSIKDLMKFKGVGEAKAIAIAATLEIGRRKASQEMPEEQSINSSKDAFLHFLPHLTDLRTEEFWALFLNQKNKIIYQFQISKGGLSSTSVDIRVLFKIALEHFATAIIVAHNHPTGDPQPSKEDLKITENIKNAGEILNIHLLDHLIIGGHNFFSFKDQGLL